MLNYWIWRYLRWVNTKEYFNVNPIAISEKFAGRIWLTGQLLFFLFSVLSGITSVPSVLSWCFFFFFCFSRSICTRLAAMLPDNDRRLLHFLWEALQDRLLTLDDSSADIPRGELNGAYGLLSSTGGPIPSFGLACFLSDYCFLTMLRRPNRRSMTVFLSENKSWVRHLSRTHTIACNLSPSWHSFALFAWSSDCFFFFSWIVSRFATRTRWWTVHLRRTHTTSASLAWFVYVWPLTQVDSLRGPPTPSSRSLLKSCPQQVLTVPRRNASRWVGRTSFGGRAGVLESQCGRPAPCCPTPTTRACSSRWIVKGRPRWILRILLSGEFYGDFLTFDRYYLFFLVFPPVTRPFAPPLIEEICMNLTQVALARDPRPADTQACLSARY